MKSRSRGASGRSGERSNRLEDSREEIRENDKDIKGEIVSNKEENLQKGSIEGEMLL